MLDSVEQQLPGSSVWKIYSGEGAPEGAFEAGLCGTATAWFFSQEDLGSGGGRSRRCFLMLDCT